ncbi:MAG TPA: methyltransferase, partial [Polyangiaceae bacterium]|nr:methyltransferase [Polyangiaceae bacterium]
MGLTVMDAPLIASLYPFSEVKRLCDVGGGRGTLLSEIVMRHPHLRGVLHDSPGVIASAGQLLADRGLEQRVELSPGDFFEAVPPGCDAYLMKNILHDWDDATCERLLRVVRSAAQPGARMLLCESLVEKNSRELIGTKADLQMMIACDNGRERGLAEFQRLLAQTGFRYRRVFSFPTLSVIEAEAA